MSTGARALVCALWVSSWVMVGCKDHSVVQPDVTPPPAIQILAASALSDSSVRLSWHSAEQAAVYEIGISEQPLALTTDGGWDAAAKVSFRDSLEASTYVIQDLKEATKYYFAIRSQDAAGNLSGMSIIASATTDEKPPVFFAAWGSRGSGPGAFLSPVGIAVAGTGPFHLLVADDGNHRVQSLDPNDGSFQTQWGSFCDLSTGTGCVDPDGAGPLELGDGQFGSIGGIATDSWGDVYIGDRTNRRILKFDATGRFLKKWDVAFTVDGVRSPATPVAIDIDSDGDVYVVAGYIFVYDPEGTLLKRINAPLPDAQPMMASDHRGHLYLDSPAEDRGQVFEVSTEGGALLRRWGDLSAETCARGQLFVPQGLGVDDLGDVFVPDGCSRIQKFAPDGTFLTQWGSLGSGPGQFDLPRDVLVSRDAIYVLEDSAPGSGRSQTRIQLFFGSHLHPRANLATPRRLRVRI